MSGKKPTYDLPFGVVARFFLSMSYVDRRFEFLRVMYEVEVKRGTNRIRHLWRKEQREEKEEGNRD